MSELTQSVVLHSMSLLARDTVALEFRPAGAGALRAFAAGAHVDILLPTGMRRSYSLINAQGETHRYVVGIKKAEASRGGSAYLHDKARVGQVFQVSAPRNNFSLIEDAPEAVFIAGGIGITPIWCMIQRQQSLGRPWALHYACRTRADAAFLAELEALPADRQAACSITFDHEPGGRMLDLAAIIAEARPGAHLYACGPAPLLDAFERASRSRPREQVHLERFTGVGDPAAAPAGGFEVVLARQGRAVRVDAGKTILDALLDHGVNVGFSCMEGICGSCKVAVLDGIPEHRDLVLSHDEQAQNNCMMVCCSGSRSSRLVLDL